MKCTPVNGGACQCVGTAPSCDSLASNTYAQEFCGLAVCPQGQTCRAVYDTSACPMLVGCTCQ